MTISAATPITAAMAISTGSGIALRRLKSCFGGVELHQPLTRGWIVERLQKSACLGDASLFNQGMGVAQFLFVHGKFVTGTGADQGVTNNRLRFDNLNCTDS